MSTSKDTYTTSTLPNGLRFLYVPAPDRGSVCITLVGKVGHRVEDDYELGAAHFLEHLFFDGTKKRPNAMAINRIMDDTGAAKNGTTTTETVEYYAKVITEKAEVAFDFISDIFLSSLLEDIDKERSVIAQEAAAHNDNPNQALYWQERPTLYLDRRLGRTFADEAANLPNMTHDIVRDYYKRMYVAQNFILCVAGGLNQDNAEKWATKYFSDIPSGREIIFQKPKFNSAAVTNIQHRETQQSKLSFIFRGFDFNNEKAPAARMLGIILGQGTSSRLIDRLRHQLHLVYSVSAYNSGLSDTGEFAIKTSMDETDLQRTADEIVEQIHLLLDEGITDDELEKAKNVSLSHLLFSTENPTSLGDIYTYRYLLCGKIKEINEITEEIRATTKKQVLEVAQTIFADKPKVNVLTPKLKELRVDPIL